jgi:pyruvate,water dikinase
MALAAVRRHGLTNRVGAMIEVPSAALCVGDFVDAGAACLVVGLNDLTGLVLGASRTAMDFDYSHPAIWHLVEYVWNVAQDRTVDFRIAGNYPDTLVTDRHGIPLDAWTVHYADWSRLVDPSLGSYRESDLVRRLRRRSDEKLVQAGLMHPMNAVVAAGLRGAGGASHE